MTNLFSWGLAHQLQGVRLVMVQCSAKSASVAPATTGMLQGFDLALEQIRRPPTFWLVGFMQEEHLPSSQLPARRWQQAAFRAVTP